MFLVAACGMSAASAVAQDDVLAGVTMRVLDDLSGVDAVILELDAAENEQPAEVVEAGAEGAADDERAEEPGDTAPAENRDGERPAEPPPPTP